MMNRRELLARTGAATMALGLGHFPLGWTARADTPKRRILMYTRSQGFEHSVVKRGKNNELSLAERIVKELGEKKGFEVLLEADVEVAADPDETVIKSYDAVLASHPEYANRTSYVIAPDHSVLMTYTNMDPDKHVELTLAAVKKWHDSQAAK